LSQERACILESAPDRTEQKQFHAPAPLFDEGLLAGVRTIKFGSG
jgi:hypothetical protein